MVSRKYLALSFLMTLGPAVSATTVSNTLESTQTQSCSVVMEMLKQEYSQSLGHRRAEYETRARESIAVQEMVNPVINRITAQIQREFPGLIDVYLEAKRNRNVTVHAQAVATLRKRLRELMAPYSATPLEYHCLSDQWVLSANQLTCTHLTETEGGVLGFGARPKVRMSEARILPGFYLTLSGGRCVSLKDRVTLLPDGSAIGCGVEDVLGNEHGIDVTLTGPSLQTGYGANGSVYPTRTLRLEDFKSAPFTSENFRIWKTFLPYIPSQMEYVMEHRELPAVCRRGGEGRALSAQIQTLRNQKGVDGLVFNYGVKGGERPVDSWVVRGR